jgi:hypothetical protein
MTTLYVPQASFQYICKSSGLTIRIASTEFQYLQTHKLTIKAHQRITYAHGSTTWHVEKSEQWKQRGIRWLKLITISGYNSTRLAVAGC